MFFVVHSNCIHLSQLIALTILQFIGHLFLSWLAFTSPAQAQATPQATFILNQSAQLEQTAPLPFWKESASSVWTHLSESLEESAAENEEDNDEGEAAAIQQILHASAAHDAASDNRNRTFFQAKVPLYLRYCILKIDLV